ncbi:MAG TPA: DinB family protein [Gemmatimonadales bacterium]|nr:DinB family protein [Gemmatimonadales bacterium]
MTVAVRPDSAEVPPGLAGYVGKVRDGENVMALLEGQVGEVRSAFGRFPEARGTYRYAPGKWSVKELVCHLSDTERIFCYRALRFARGDATPLASFDENAYAREMYADDRPLADLLDELFDVRRATLSFFRGLRGEAWIRRGTASGKEVSVRAMAYAIAGHTRHHLEVLAERYR